MARNIREALIRQLVQAQLAGVASDQAPLPLDDLVLAAGLSIGTSASLRKGSGFFDPAHYSVRLSTDLQPETPLNRNRRRFTLAHEFGHCLLEHGEQHCWDVGLAAEGSDLEALADLPNFEAEAHEFARELLLPRAWLERDWLAKQDAKHWSRQYGVAESTFFIVLDQRHLLEVRKGKR